MEVRVESSIETPFYRNLALALGTVQWPISHCLQPAASAVLLNFFELKVDTTLAKPTSNIKYSICWFIGIYLVNNLLLFEPFGMSSFLFLIFLYWWSYCESVHFFLLKTFHIYLLHFRTPISYVLLLMCTFLHLSSTSQYTYVLLPMCTILYLSYISQYTYVLTYVHNFIPIFFSVYLCTLFYFSSYVYLVPSESVGASALYISQYVYMYTCEW